MTLFFQEAARLNNSGIEALAQGNEQKAIVILMQTIKMMKKILAKTDINQLQSNEEESHTDRLQTIEIPEITCTEEFFFNEAIKIPCNGKATVLDIYMYSAAVIFNLALAHHAKAATDSKYLLKAEELYATIPKLLDDRVSHMRPAVILTLASINNMSYIRFENGNFDQIKEGLAEVNGLLKNTNNILFEEPEVQGLLMNVLLLKNPKVAAAA